MLEISEDNNLSMLTYPRSGRHWLYWYINTNTDLKVNFAHYDIKEANDPTETLYQKILSDPIITVVRNPVDCLSSINTMEDNGMFIYRAQQYLDHYRFILENCSTFFKFEDLKENTEIIVKYICEKFNGTLDIKSDSFSDYEAWYKETQNPFKLISSKTNSKYINNLDYIKQMDLSEHYRLYSIARSRCINL